jgi:hypothetical protein
MHQPVVFEPSTGQALHHNIYAYKALYDGALVL